jgi:hypothetical protein
MAEAVNINDLLDGHVGLDLECLDRIYLNAYVPNLQVGGQVVRFLTEHLGNPIPSPVLFQRIGERFRREVARFAERDHIPLLHSSGRTVPAGTTASWTTGAPTWSGQPGPGWWRSWPLRSSRRCSSGSTAPPSPGWPALTSPRSTGGSASTTSMSWTPTSAPASSSCAATSPTRARSG